MLSIPNFLGLNQMYCICAVGDHLNDYFLPQLYCPNSILFLVRLDLQHNEDGKVQQAQEVQGVKKVKEVQKVQELNEVQQV